MRKAISVLLKLFVFTSFFVATAIGQSNYSEFLNESDEHKKAEIGLELIEYYTRKDVDSLKVIAAELLMSDSDEEVELSKVVGDYSLGVYFSRKGQIKEGVECLKRSLHYFQRRMDFDNSSLILNQLGNSYVLDGEYMNAIQFYIKSLDVGLRAVDEEYQYVGKIGLSKSYFFLGDTVKGISMMLQYKNDALKFGRFEAAANAFSILGMVELDRGEIQKSLQFFEKSIALGLKSKSLMQLSHVYTNKAIVFFTIDELDSSLVYFEKALKTRVKLNNPRQITEAYFNLTSYYTEQGLYEEALVPAHATLNIAIENNLIVDEVDAYDLLKEIYAGLGEVEQLAKLKTKQDAVKLELDNKQQLDKELIEYLQQLSNEPTERKIKSEIASKKPIWIIGLLIVFILFGGLFLKKFTT